MLKGVARPLMFVFSIMLFVFFVLPVLSADMRISRDSIAKTNLSVEEVIDVERPEKLEVVSGNDVLGMVHFALRGEYDLVLDGILIQEGSDIESVNFSGVAGQTYSLTVDVNTSTGKTTVIATLK